MISDCPLVALVATTNAHTAREFYGQILGLRLTHEDSFGLVFDAHGSMLRISVVGQLAPAPYTILGWQVEDIASIVRQLGEKGVTFERYPGMPQDDPGIWTTPDGSRVAWFKDPEGNTLSLTAGR